MAGATIDVMDLKDLSSWLDENVLSTGVSETARGGDRIVSWCEARGVDPAALVRFSIDQTDTMMMQLANGLGGAVDCVRAVAIAAFMLGLEAEQRRRDRQEFGS